MEILAELVSDNVQIKEELELVNILARVQIFAEVDVKVAINAWVNRIELLEVLVREIKISELRVDQKISRL